jgi:hypothetical protein
MRLSPSDESEQPSDLRERAFSNAIFCWRELVAEVELIRGFVVKGGKGRT